MTDVPNKKKWFKVFQNIQADLKTKIYQDIQADCKVKTYQDIPADHKVDISNSYMPGIIPNPPNAERVYNSFTYNAAGDFINYTVPIGKTLFLRCVNFSLGTRQLAEVDNYVYVDTNLGVFVFRLASIAAYGSSVSTSIFCNYNPAFVIPAGYRIRIFIESNAVTRACGSWWGWLE